MKSNPPKKTDVFTATQVGTLIESLRSQFSVFAEDLTTVKRTVTITNEELGRQKEDIHSMKADIHFLKTDVAVLKTDVAVLKTDVAVLKTDVTVLKTDVTVLKKDVKDLKIGQKRLETKFDSFSQDLNVRVTRLESVVKP